MVRTFLAVLCGCAVIQAQPATKLEFEVASIKPSPPPAPGMGILVGCRGGPGTNDPSLYTCQNISLSNLVTMAYRIAYYQLSAPDWATMTRFDLRAKLPQDTTKEQLALMMQSLLADRFQLAVHRESREMQRYELTVAKNGPKFKEAAPPAPADSRDAAPTPGPPKLDKEGYPVIGPRGGMAIVYDKARMYQPEMTMTMLASQLSGQLRGPVVDATGLTGKYAISVYWSAGDSLRTTAPAPGQGPTPADTVSTGPDLKQALQEQLGLRVESKKGPVEFVIVDHAEKTPTEN
jgi:uncharacterized protein (TIGR03435 family)